MLMNARDRGVDRDDPVDLPCSVCLLLHLSEQLLPGAVRGPTIEPLVDRVPLPESLRHVASRGPGAVLPRHPLDREPVIRPRPGTTRHRRHQRLQHSPHLIGDLSSRHHSRLAHETQKHLDQHGLSECVIPPLFVLRYALLLSGLPAASHSVDSDGEENDAAEDDALDDRIHLVQVETVIEECDKHNADNRAPHGTRSARD